jgi:hypothetical protein
VPRGRNSSSQLAPSDQDRTSRMNSNVSSLWCSLRRLFFWFIRMEERKREIRGHACYYGKEPNKEHENGW